MQTAVLPVDEPFNLFASKKRQIVGLECGTMSPLLKREHVRAPQKLFWLGCQLEPNCVTFLCETQTAKIEHGLRITSHEIA